MTVRYVDNGSAPLIDNLIGDRCDIAILRGQASAPQRQARLAFSRPLPVERHLRHRAEVEPRDPRLGRPRQTRA